MNEHLKQAGIKFPKYWSEESVIEGLSNFHDENLYEYFEVKNSAALSRKLNPYFPNRPPKVSFHKYLKDVLAQPIKERPKIKFGAAREESFEEEQARLNR